MKKPVFSIIFCFVILAQIACGQTQPSNSESKTLTKTEETKSDYPNLKTQSEEVAKATASGDFAKLVDFTYPKIVEKAGGKDKMIAFLKDDSAQMKAEGFELEDVIVGEIKQIAKIDNQIFALVPITLKMKSPNARYIGESSMVGISNNNGSNWKFINAVNQEKFKAMFPKAAEKIQIPVEQMPKPIENE